jgi:hypothetical protein
MNVTRFDQNDRGYLDWLAVNPNGYVINIERSVSGSDARLHRASCRTISGQPSRGNTWTGPYIKVCSNDIAALDGWATEATGAPIRRCGICHHVRSTRTDVAQPASSEHIDTQAVERSSGDAVATGEVRGPYSGKPIVEAWTNEYIRFEHRTAQQEQLRSEIRARVRQLSAAPDQVLHATYFGPKHPAADVENLVLYYIDDSGTTFSIGAAQFGLRFELAPRCPPAPSWRTYRYGYRYELAPRHEQFMHWVEGRELASWKWIELGRFDGPKKLEQVWLALIRGAVHVSAVPRNADTLFAVRVAVQPPAGVTPNLGYLVKGVIDGVVCAFQAQTDRTNLADIAIRLSSLVPAPPDEIAALLTSSTTAVLGVVPRLVHLRSTGVIWAPGDDRCVAGELLATQAVGSTWRIAGRVLELSPRSPNSRAASELAE